MQQATYNMMQPPSVGLDAQTDFMDLSTEGVNGRRGEMVIEGSA